MKKLPESTCAELSRRANNLKKTSGQNLTLAKYKDRMLEARRLEMLVEKSDMAKS